MPWRSRWSGLKLSITATSGANAAESSSWKEEHSQTTVSSPRSRGGSAASGRADVPGDGDAALPPPARRGRATRRRSSCRSCRSPRRSGSEASASPVRAPRSRSFPLPGRLATTAASCGTPGLLITAFTRSRSSVPSPSRLSSTPRSASLLASGGFPESVPYTRSPRASRASAAAIPERASPTTRKGPSGSGGRSVGGDMPIASPPAWTLLVEPLLLTRSGGVRSRKSRPMRP